MAPVGEERHYTVTITIQNNPQPALGEIVGTVTYQGGGPSCVGDLRFGSLVNGRASFSEVITYGTDSGCIGGRIELYRLTLKSLGYERYFNDVYSAHAALILHEGW